MFSWLKSKVCASVGIAACPKCGSRDVEKEGLFGGTQGKSSFIQASPPQQYRCKSCGHTWTWDGLPPGLPT